MFDSSYKKAKVLTQSQDRNNNRVSTVDLESDSGLAALSKSFNQRPIGGSTKKKFTRIPQENQFELSSHLAALTSKRKANKRGPPYII